MIRSRRTSLLAALAALAAMLFLQAAMAFAPCDEPGHRAGMAAMQHATMPDCDTPVESTTLCAAKTHNEDQALGKTQLGVPDLAAPAADVRPSPAAVHAPVRVERIMPTASPPPRILFQSFRL